MPLRPRAHRAVLLVAVLLTATLVAVPAAAQTTSSTASTSSTSSTTTTTAAPRTTAHQMVVDITFPADPRVTFTGTYDAPRDGGARVHKATDLMGQKGWKLYAAAAGTVCFITGIDAATPSYGFMLTICGDDGREYSYIHLNNDDPGTDDGLGGPENAYAPRIRKGIRVTRGQWIGLLGDSGNSEGTAPHLHFEIEDPTITDPYGTHMLDPWFSLDAAKRRKDLPVDPGPPVLDRVERVAGADRIATAVALSQAAFERAPAVVLASATSVPDAIAASPLAGVFGGPVLISGAEIDDRVVGEVKRLGASTIAVIGGPSVFPATTEDALATATGIPATAIHRYAGEDRYATAAAVAARVWEAVPQTRRRAVVALGAHTDPTRAWPDALAAGWLGAATSAPVLLVTLDGVPEATDVALEGVRDASVVGGVAAVPDAVFKAVQAKITNPLRRLSGADRYATSTAVAAEAAAAGASLQRVWTVTGRSPYDALAIGAAVARLGQTLVLIDGLERRSDALSGRWLRARVALVVDARVVGGTTVMTEAARARLALRIT